MASAVRCEATDRPAASSKRDSTMTIRCDPRAERSRRRRATATACPAAGTTRGARPSEVRNARPLHEPRMLDDRLVFEPQDLQAIVLDGRKLRVRRRRDGRGGIACDHETGHGLFLVRRARAQGVCRVDCMPRTGDPVLEPLEHPRFVRFACDKMKHVDRPALPDAIHASDSLLEPHRVPWQLEVDHDPAPLVKIQAFAGGVGRQQDPAAAADEGFERQRSVPRASGLRAGATPDDAIASRRCSSVSRYSVKNHDRFADRDSAGGRLRRASSRAWPRCARRQPGRRAAAARGRHPRAPRPDAHAGASSPGSSSPPGSASGKSSWRIPRRWSARARQAAARPTVRAIARWTAPACAAPPAATRRLRTGVRRGRRA